MSDQPPLVPPTPQTQAGPAFEPYAPAWGETGGEAPAGFRPAAPVPYQVAPQFVVNPAAPTHPMAIASLVLGVIGILSVLLTPLLGISLVGGICSPFATWLGAWSKRIIRDNPQSYSGSGMATAGFITGIVGMALALLALVLVLLFVVFVVAIFAGASS